MQQKHTGTIRAEQIEQGTNEGATHLHHITGALPNKPQCGKNNGKAKQSELGSLLKLLIRLMPAPRMHAHTLTSTDTHARAAAFKRHGVWVADRLWRQQR